jgi:DNA recombination-dependent growth factor C
MGFVSGTVNFTRYRVEGSPPEDYFERYPEKITRYAFRDIHENSLDQRAVGWVDIMDMFNNRFDGMEFFREPYLALSFRLDLKRVSPKTLKQYCRQSELEVIASENLQFLTKDRRDDIKSAVNDKLLRRVIPVSNTYDMLWNLQTGKVLFGCVKSIVCDEFAELFYNTFGLFLTAVIPYSLVCQTIEKEGKDPNLAEVMEPTNFL